MVLLSVGILAVCACAETLVMGKDDAGDKFHSFCNPTDWIREDGSTVNSAPVAGNDYIVANSLEMNVNATKSFAGDSLQFGYAGGTKGYFFHTGSGNTVTVGSLKLANGRYRVWQNKDTVATSYLNGNVEVLSPADEPFLISPTHIGGATSYSIQWNANIKGKTGTGILIASLSNAIGVGTPRLVFAGDNSGYLGKIMVKDTNLTFSVTKATALGGALSEFDASALSLDAQCIFECTAETATLSASANRGITVKSGGAKINIPANKMLCVEWPMALDGKFEKVGAGTLVLASQMTYGDNGAFVVSEGYVSVPAGKTSAVEHIVFAGGALAVSYDPESGASGVLEVDEWPLENIKVRPPAERGVKIPFLKVPLSSGEVASSDITAVADLASSGFPSFKVTVATEGDYQVAYLETAKTITVADGANAVYALLNGEGWSDGELMHSCGDYLVDAKTAARALTFGVGELASLDDSVLNYEMPAGASLTFTGNDNAIAKWLIRQKTFTGDVRAVGRKIEFYACGNTKATSASPYEESSGDEHVLKGSLFIDNDEPSDGGLRIYVGSSRTLRIESEISGDGTVCMRNLGSGSAQTRSSTFVLSGTNSFEGKIFLYNAFKTACTNTLRFSEECNLGSGTARKDSELLLQGNSEDTLAQLVLHPIGSVRVNLPNRTLNLFAGNLNVNVDEGSEFKWDSPVKFRSGTTKNLTVVSKFGAGTWAVGGNVKLVESDGVADIWTLNVDEGYIRADNARAFSGMTVTFAEGAGIAAEYDPEATGESSQYGMIVTDPALFTVAGEKLAVKVETGGDLMLNKSVPVLTVPASMADGIEGKLSGICDLPKGGVVFVRENLELDDAQYVRFSAEIRRGTVVVVR